MTALSAAFYLIMTRTLIAMADQVHFDAALDDHMYGTGVNAGCTYPDWATVCEVSFKGEVRYPMAAAPVHEPFLSGYASWVTYEQRARTIEAAMRRHPSYVG